jgi:hypothetical protein
MAGMLLNGLCIYGCNVVTPKHVMRQGTKQEPYSSHSVAMKTRLTRSLGREEALDHEPCGCP